MGIRSLLALLPAVGFGEEMSGKTEGIGPLSGRSGP